MIIASVSSGETGECRQCTHRRPDRCVPHDWPRVPAGTRPGAVVFPRILRICLMRPRAGRVKISPPPQADKPRERIQTPQGLEVGPPACLSEFCRWALTEVGTSVEVMLGESSTRPWCADLCRGVYREVRLIRRNEGAERLLLLGQGRGHMTLEKM